MRAWQLEVGPAGRRQQGEGAQNLARAPHSMLISLSTLKTTPQTTLKSAIRTPCSTWPPLQTLTPPLQHSMPPLQAGPCRHCRPAPRLPPHPGRGAAPAVHKVWVHRLQQLQRNGWIAWEAHAWALRRRRHWEHASADWTHVQPGCSCRGVRRFCEVQTKAGSPGLPIGCTCRRPWPGPCG